MSRIGNRILKIPTACDVEVSAGNVVISGPRGRLTCPYVPRYVAVKQNRQQQTLAVTRRRLTKHAKQLHGTTNALLNNHLVGVTQG